MNYARRSALRFSVVGLCLCGLFVALAASATSVLDLVPTLENIRGRLELSTEQEAKLRPLFAQRASDLAQTQTLLQQAATKQEWQSILRDAKKAAASFSSQVEAVLTPSQKHEWREIRAEVREKVKYRAEEKRD